MPAYITRRLRVGLKSSHDAPTACVRITVGQAALTTQTPQYWGGFQNRGTSPTRPPSHPSHRTQTSWAAAVARKCDATSTTIGGGSRGADSCTCALTVRGHIRQCFAHEQPPQGQDPLPAMPRGLHVAGPTSATHTCPPGAEPSIPKAD